MYLLEIQTPQFFKIYLGITSGRLLAIILKMVIVEVTDINKNSILFLEFFMDTPPSLMSHVKSRPISTHYQLMFIISFFKGFASFTE